MSELSDSVKKQIEDSAVFVCLVPEGGVEGSGYGEAQLRQAMEYKKPIFVWMPEGNRPFPHSILKDYKGFVVDIEGDQEALLYAIEKNAGVSAEEINLVDGGYTNMRTAQ